jgi:hydroxymethylglutaryl-CoA reductase (NADPH)
VLCRRFLRQGAPELDGGTGLKTQTEARNIIKVNKSNELAEVVGAAVLAGELSLLASIAEGSLARSHAKLGR